MTEEIKAVAPSVADTVISYKVADASIAELKEKYKGMTAENPKEYKALTAAVGEVRTLRTSVEKRRKALKADALKYGKNVDSEAARITELLVEVEDPLKAVKKEYDDAAAKAKEEKERIERERVDAIHNRIKVIRDLPHKAHSASCEDLENLIVRIKAVPLDAENFAEFLEEAKEVISGSIDILSDILASKIKSEADAKKVKELEDAIAAEKAKEPVKLPDPEPIAAAPRRVVKIAPRDIKPAPAAKPTPSEPETFDVESSDEFYLNALYELHRSGSLSIAEKEAVAWACDNLSKGIPANG